MNNLKGFPIFEKTVRSIISGIKTAWNGGKRRMLVVYLIFLLVVLLVGFLGVVGAVTGGLEALELIKDNIYAPKQQLTYKQTDEIINERGDYLTTFTVMISMPQGQGTGLTLFNAPNGCDTENLNLLSGGANIKNGTIYAEASYEVKCITRYPINDNYRLFTLEK